MPYTTIEGVEIFYETQGEGDPVVLLHHGFGSSAMWKDIVPGLARSGHQVIVYDRRGFGRSGVGEHFAEYYVSDSFRENVSWSWTGFLTTSVFFRKTKKRPGPGPGYSTVSGPGRKQLPKDLIVEKGQKAVFFSDKGPLVPAG